MSKPYITENQISQALQQFQPQPAESWVQAQMQHLQNLEDSSPRHSFQDLFFSIISMPRQRILFSSLAAVAMVAIAGFAYASFRPNSYQTLNLSAEEQKNILSEIVKNNSSASIFTTRGTAPEATSALATAGAADSSVKMIAPIPPQQADYNYRYSKITTTPGNKKGFECEMMDLNEDSSNNNIEGYEYTNSDTGQYAHKTTFRDKNNQLTQYTLDLSQNNKSETYEYRGGKYAVKTEYKYEAVKPMPAEIAPDAPADSNTVAPAEPMVDTKPSTDDLISQYFGPDVKIVAKATENGKEFYVLEYSQDVYCDARFRIMAATGQSNASDSDNKTKLVWRNWIDTQDFSIYKSFTYVDNTDDANLLATTITITESKKTSFESVADKFVFEYNVPVKNISNNQVEYNFENNLSQNIKYLADQNISLLVADSAGTEVTGLYSIVNEMKIQANKDSHYLDRDFYPAGSRGDEDYQLFKASMTLDPAIPLAEANISFGVNNGNQIVYVTIFNSKYSIDAIAQTRSFKEETSRQSENISLTIDGKNVPATKYVLKSKLTAYPEGSTTQVMPVDPGIGGCGSEDCSTYTQMFVLFNYGNQNYLIDYGESDAGVSVTNFKTLSTRDTAKMNELKAKLIELTQRPISVEGSGASPETLGR